MHGRHLAVEVLGDGVATVTLDKPPVNALGPAIRQEIVATFDALSDRADVRVIVLRGNGRIFCAGADIKEKRGIGDAPGAHAATNRLIREAYYCILECSKPVIAAVNGAAIGAGLVMATCCDFVVASEDAMFAMPEIDVGLAGGAALLQRALPIAAIRKLLLTGDRVPAAELYRLGALEACVPAEEVMPRALHLAGRIAAKSSVAVRAIRQSFLTVESLPLREALRFEQEVTVALSRSDDAREAQAAFLEKRTPTFQGR